MPRARGDVDAALGIWTELLRETLGDALVALYAKGSAVKAWDGPFDYVPILSDVDLHVETAWAGGLSRSAESAFDVAMRLSREHEHRFLAARPDALHTPRAQVSLLNDLKRMPGVVLATRGVRVLAGEAPAVEPPGPQEVRAIDHGNLLALEAVLDSIPGALADRSGIDLWTLVRRLTWRVSPAPVRLVASRADDPLEVWSWNRTQVLAALEAQGYGDVAAAWRGWYGTGWRLFLADWRDSDLLREAIAYGHEVLRLCHEAARAREAARPREP